jgi:hypothetical protein
MLIAASWALLLRHTPAAHLLADGAVPPLTYALA